MKLCDITQFWSPVSGGVKRYVSEKVRYLREHVPGGRHVLIVPGERDAVTGDEQARVYTIASPLLSRVTGYRVLLRLVEIDRILAEERPDLIECGDPYQVGWRTAAVGRQLGIPTVAFYHSHFAESYVRPLKRWVGESLAGLLTDVTRGYAVRLYRQFAATLVPADSLVEELSAWGLENAQPQPMGVDTAVFSPGGESISSLRLSLGLPQGAFVFLYVGRLAGEKNTQTLWPAFRQLVAAEPQQFHLMVVGDGLQRGEVEALARETGAVSWTSYCNDARQLARIYRAADVLVHPGMEETFGLVALEAQACGRYVLGLRGARMEAAALVDRTGWAEANTSAALASAMRRVSLNPDLDATGRALSAAVRARYAWPIVLERQFDFYRQLIQESTRR